MEVVSNNVITMKATPKSVAQPMPSTRKQDSSREMDILRSKLAELQQRHLQLESTREELQNNVMDLRKLVQLIQRQGSQELERCRMENLPKQEKRESLSKALQVAYTQGGDLQKIGRFWSEFC